MAMLSESELNVIRQMWQTEQVVSLAGVGLLLGHIEAQDEALKAIQDRLDQSGAEREHARYALGILYKDAPRKEEVSDGE